MISKYLWYSFADSRRPSPIDQRLERQAQQLGVTGQSSPMPQNAKVVPTAREVEKAREKASGGKKDRCNKGTSCGAACIHANDRCLQEFPAPMSEGVRSLSKVLSDRLDRGDISEEDSERFFSQLKGLDSTQVKSFEAFSKLIKEGRVTEDEMEQVANLLYSVTITPKQADRGAARVMSFDEVKAIHESGRLQKLEEAYKASIKNGVFDPNAPGGMADYIDKNVKQVIISNEVATLAYGMLPRAARSALNKSGSVSGDGQVFNGYDKEGNIIYGSIGNNARGVFMVQRWMEQKGLDPFTGKYIDLRAGEPEHLFSWGKAKKTGGKGDQPGNMAIAAPQTNNSKAIKGIDDDFVKWAKQIKEWYDMGPERYQNEVVKAKQEKAAATSSKKAGAKSEVERAFNSLTPQERVSTILASAKVYGDRVRYLIIAAGLESGQWAQKIPGARAARRKELDARAEISIAGKVLKPSAAILATTALLEPSQRESFLSQVDQLRLARSPSSSEIKEYEGRKDPKYLARLEELDREFENKLSSLIQSVAPDLKNLI